MEESEKKRQEQLRRDNERLQKLMDQALMMEHIPAKETGNLAFLARILVLATMPHSKPDALYFERRNGNFRLAMIADPRFGLPYGSLSRLILAWVTTQAIKNSEPVVELGCSMSGFMKELGLTPTGGEHGSIRRFQDHVMRLFTTAVAFSYDGESQWTDKRFMLTEMTNWWWNPKDFRAVTRPSQVCLSTSFYEELSKHPVPLDLRALATLRKSPFAMDIYNWLTYRYHAMSSPTVISWESLMMQFGSSYGHKDQFRQNFLKQLRKVKVLYPKANIEEVKGKGMKLWPSPTHITPVH